VTGRRAAVVSRQMFKSWMRVAETPRVRIAYDFQPHGTKFAKPLTVEHFSGYIVSWGRKR
jgi:hypothetical protein